MSTEKRHIIGEHIRRTCGWRMISDGWHLECFCCNPDCEFNGVRFKEPFVELEKSDEIR